MGWKPLEEGIRRWGQDHLNLINFSKPAGVCKRTKGSLIFALRVVWCHLDCCKACTKEIKDITELMKTEHSGQQIMKAVKLKGLSTYK